MKIILLELFGIQNSGSPKGPAARVRDRRLDNTAELVHTTVSCGDPMTDMRGRHPFGMIPSSVLRR